MRSKATAMAETIGKRIHVALRARARRLTRPTRDWERVSALAVLLGWCTIAACAGWLAPRLGPDLGAWLVATRSVLIQVVLVVLLSLPGGTLLGVAAALGPRVLQGALTRAVELTGALPSLIVVGLWRVGSSSATTLGFILVVALLKAIEVARLIAEQTAIEQRRQHVTAAHALGNRPGRIFRVHILPRLFPPLIIETGSVAAYTVGLEAAASFIGLGPEHLTSWGTILGRAARRGGEPTGLVWACLLSLTATTLALHALGSRPRDEQSNRAFQALKTD